MTNRQRKGLLRAAVHRQPELRERRIDKERAHNNVAVPRVYDFVPLLVLTVVVPHGLVSRPVDTVATVFIIISSVHHHCAARVNVLQRNFRGYVARDEFERQKKFANTIQKHMRGRLQRIKFQESIQKRDAAYILQRNIRGKQARNRLDRQHIAAKHIQNQFQSSCWQKPFVLHSPD